MTTEAPDRGEDAVAFFRSLTPDQVTAGIARAIKAHDFEAVVVLLKVLAVKDPHKASVLYGSMMAVLEA